MGRPSTNPRKNVVSCRVNNDLRSCIENARGQLTVQDFVHAAIEHKLIADRQARIDEVTRCCK